MAPSSSDGYVLGIDLGGTGIKAGLVSSKGEILKEWKTPTEARKGGKHVVEKMIDLCRRMTDELPAQVRKKDILGVGIGSPGVFDYATGALVAGAVNIPGLNGTPMRSLFETSLKLPARVDNDANAFVLAEARYGAGQGASVAVGYTIGTGIGGGVVIEGKVFHGAWNFAGELGHVTVEPEGIYCPCGNHGCMESYASANAIATYAQQMAALEQGSLLSKLKPEEITCKAVGEAASQGDRVALHVIARAAHYLAIGIGAAVITLNPAVVILGGGGALLGEMLFQPIREGLARRVYHQRVREVPVVAARLGVDAGVVGAAGLVFADL
ncbi:MAG: ROK family protein [Candidatus Omnitrophica bacterium]|nr:Glucokinase [bacterium]NUN94589.1 ROK family protein [Candidatus Omnitrophota bacterium]